LAGVVALLEVVKWLREQDPSCALGTRICAHWRGSRQPSLHAEGSSGARLPTWSGCMPHGL